MFPHAFRAAFAGARGRLPVGVLASGLILLAPACNRSPAPPGEQAPAQPPVAERGVPPAGDAEAEPLDLQAIIAPYEAIGRAYAVRDEGAAAGLDWNALLDGYDPSEKPADVKERSGEIKILGCELTLDFGAVQRCLDRKIRDLKDDVERQVRAAQNALKAEFTKQIEAAKTEATRAVAKANAHVTLYKERLAGLQTQLQTLQKDVQAEVDRRLRQAQAEAAKVASDLRTQVQAAQQLAAKAQADATRELQRATNLQAIVANLEKQLKDAQANLGLDIDWQRQLLAGIQALRLDELFRCLGEDANKAKFDVVQAIQQFAQDPVRFVQRTLDGVVQQFGARFDALFGQELRDMAAGKPFPTGVQLVRRAIDKLGILADAAGGRCLFEHVRPQLEQSATAVAQIAMQAAAKLQNEARRVFEEKIAPEVFKAMASTLQAVLREQLQNAGVPAAGTGGLPPGLATLLLTEDEMKGVARGVLFQRNVRERFEIAQVNMKALLDPATAAGAVNGHMTNLRKLIQGTKDYEALYLEIGVEMLRVMAHKYMKSKEAGHGGQLLDQAIGLLQTGEGTVEKVVSALCGLIPEAGAAICAVVEEVVELAWSNVAAVAIEGIAQGLINGAIDQLVDGFKEELLKKKNLDAIRSSVGPLGDILRALPHEQALGLWAGAVLKDEMEVLNRHFSSLVDLAAKARG
jgi:hypothetical protein